MLSSSLIIINLYMFTNVVQTVEKIQTLSHIKIKDSAISHVKNIILVHQRMNILKENFLRYCLQGK